MAIEHRMDGALGRDRNSGESAQEALANLARTPARVLALHVQDEVFHLEGKLIRIAVGPSASVRQPLYPTLLVAIEDFVARLARDPKLPAEIRHLLAGEPRTAAFHPSPNTPSTASLPPRKQEEVSPMCPVRCVTYVSGRSFTNSASQERSLLAQGHQAGWMSRKDCKQRRTVSSSVNRLTACSIW